MLNNESRFQAKFRLKPYDDFWKGSLVDHSQQVPDHREWVSMVPLILF